MAGKGRLIDELAQLLRLKGVPVISICRPGRCYRAVVAFGTEEAAGDMVGRPIWRSRRSIMGFELVREMPAEQLAEVGPCPADRNARRAGLDRWGRRP